MSLRLFKCGWENGVGRGGQNAQESLVIAWYSLSSRCSDDVFFFPSFILFLWELM